MAVFLVSLSVFAMIVIHELGHFLAAKVQGIKVQEFSIGFGKALIQYQRSKTLYSLRLIPFGGYVAFPDQNSNDPNLLENRPIFDRAIVISAGVIANVLTAYLMLVVYYFVNLSSGLWIAIQASNIVLYKMVILLLEGLSSIFVSPLQFGQDSIGIIGFVSAGSEVVGDTYLTVLPLFSFVSLSVAIFNALPLPALDGGHLIFLLIEAFYKPVPQHIQIRMSIFVACVLFGFGIVVTIKDLFNLLQN